MHTPAVGQERLERIRLIARVQIARETTQEAMQRYRRQGSSRARIMVAAAKARLGLLNRALAQMAVETALA